MAKQSGLPLQPHVPPADSQVGLSGEAQTTAAPGEHEPLWQRSEAVQPLPSLQLVPSALMGEEHAPVVESQAPAAWHWSAAVQVTGFAPAQVPAWHESVWVQASPSLQAVPFAIGGEEQIPVVESHEPAV